MRSEYLYRITCNYDWSYTGKTKPTIFAVASSEEEVRKYVERHLKRGATIKNVSFCGERLGMNMYCGGKPKNVKKKENR